MRHRSFLVVVACLIVAGSTIAAYLVAKAQPVQPVVTLLYPKGPADQPFWPANHSWLWSIHGLDPAAQGNTLSLVVRVVHEPLRKGESPAIGPRVISKAEAEAELSTGILRGVQPTDTAVVSVQLVDLNEAAIPAGKAPLRLLRHLAVGGSTVLRTGEQSVIEGNRIIGYALNAKPTWKDGELHLQSLFIQADNRMATYDVVLIQSK